MPSLQVPDAMGIPSLSVGAEEQQQIAERWTTFARAEAELAAWGFEPEARPLCTRPRVTADDLNTPDSRQYTTLYVQVEAWHTYAINAHARLKGVLLETQNQLKDLEVEIKSAAVREAAARKEKKPAKDILDNLPKTHPRWKELTAYAQELRQKDMLMTSYVDSISRDLALVSRQVEIRKQDFEKFGGGQSMPSRGMYPQG